MTRDKIIMNDYGFLTEMITKTNCTSWDGLPDIELYMDQVLVFLARQKFDMRGDVKITSAMINNYIKEGLLPRANGKKYSKDHLALLTVIGRLKQVLSVKDTGKLLGECLKDTANEDFYTGFLTVLEKSSQNVARDIESNISDDNMAAFALKLAVYSYLNKIACEYIIQLMNEKGEAGRRGEEDKTSDEAKSDSKKAAQKKTSSKKKEKADVKESAESEA